MFLVERTCTGCGTWYVINVRERREQDQIVERLSPDDERSFYQGEIAAKWEQAHPTLAIAGAPWRCMECRGE
jgi:hypothetical protein